MPCRMLRILAILLILLYTFTGCKFLQTQSPVPSIGKNAGEIARVVGQDVGSVGAVSKGIKGVPILILEENHDSRAGQIQLAITLVRLYNQYGMKHIALEGYLKERPKIRAEWFARAAHGDLTAKVRVAVNLLQEGEISSAEFMKLVYDDSILDPIETKGEYNVTLDEEAAQVPFLYLLKIAQGSLQKEQEETALRMQDEIEKYQGEEKQKKVAEMFDYILSANPWAKAKTKILNDPEENRVMPAEKHLELYLEIWDRAEELSLELEASDKKAMERNLQFWRKRIAASKTMVLAVSRIADCRDVSVVTMIIGAAHTEGVCNQLKAAKRPFAVVTPLSLRNYEEKGDLTVEMLERKYQKRSVYSEGVMNTLYEAFRTQNKKKPEPVLSEAWFQGKAELYLFTDRIVNTILGGSSPPRRRKASLWIFR